MTADEETPQEAANRLAAGLLRSGFRQEALHTYTAPDGSALFWRIRLRKAETGEKWIRPMKLNGQGYTLGEPPVEDQPEGKPLYRQHELVQRPDDVVVVTEGEHKADKLAALGLLVTTSGSASSAPDADWHPLAGRHVLIWPDNDDAGRQYAAAVVRELSGCTVRVVDVSALNLEVKGDAADWLAAHPEATASDVLALDCESSISPDPDSTLDVDGNGASRGIEPESDCDPAEDAPNTCKYAGGRFTLSRKGVYYSGPVGVDRKEVVTWICSPLGVIAMTRDAKSGAWGRLLEWHDDDGVRHEWAMPFELLEGDGADVRRELARLGLRIAPTRRARELLASYIKVWPVDERVRCVERLGWHGTVFATPSQTIGDAGERVVFQNTHAIEPTMSVAGTVPEWRESVAALCRGNSRMVFALCSAFAGTLLELAGEDSGGFHLRGKSSSGKTTALRAAGSVWGDPATSVRQWRATTNGLEGLAALHNDSILILDELQQVDPRQAGEAAYMLANGQGKARAQRTGAARQSYCWLLLFLSSGEMSLSAHMALADRRASAGQEIRLADIEADAGAGMGVVEDLHGHADPGTLVLAIKDAASCYHGAVGLEWLHCVARDRLSLAGILRDAIQQFVTKVLPAGATGQAERVARRFGLVAVAGYLATHYGLTGWEPDEATRAATTCFASWLDAFGGIGSREERALQEQVRAFIETHGSSRFEKVDANDEQRIINRAGFYRLDENGHREFLVLPQAFKNEMCRGFDPKFAEKTLIELGLIAPGGDGRTQKVRLPSMGSGSSRVYVLKGATWAADE